MIVGLKGAIISMLSMTGIFILALLHDSKIINLSGWASFPLVILSFVIMVLGVGHMFGEFSSQESSE